jgi:hypothetical protein
MHNTLNGYFIGDIDFTDSNNLKIKDTTLEVACINGGNIYVRFATDDLEDENNIPVFKYPENSEALNPKEYYDYLKEILL